MSDDDYCEFGGLKQPSEEQFIQINHYNGANRENNHNYEVQQTAFDQLEDIMNRQQNHTSRNEIILEEKLSEMQQKCQKLFKGNSYLTKRVEQMHAQYQEYLQNQVDLQELSQFLGQIQNQLEAYKKEWDQFKAKQTSLNDKKIGQFQQLIQTIQSQKQQISILQTQNIELITTNNGLQNRNQNLQQELQTLQRELKEQRMNKQQSKAKSFSRQTNSAFQDQVQAQLQHLIQKLMAELQFERHSHKKSMVEIKRMQQQILELERQIVSKNNKIYDLQMNNLKVNKSTNKIQKARGTGKERFREEQNESYKSKSDRTRQSVLKSFTIQQMFSGSIDVSEKERYIIGSKIVQFYLKKIELNDFVPYNSDRLMITNYNKINPSLVMIRKLTNSPYNGQLSLGTLGWNLGVILSNLLIEWRDDAQQKDQNDEYLGAAIQSLLREQLSHINQLYSLKNILDQMIRNSH